MRVFSAYRFLDTTTLPKKVVEACLKGWVLDCDGLTLSDMAKKHGCVTTQEWMIDKKDWKPYKKVRKVYL